MTTMELIKRGIDHNCLSDAYDLGRTDAIDECIDIISKIMPAEPFLKNCKHYENWRMKTLELRLLRDMLEQLKEQK